MRVLLAKEAFDRITDCSASPHFCYESYPKRSHIPENQPGYGRFALMLLCLLSRPNHVHCYFRREPENVAGKTGKVVVMNCASNDTTRPCGNLVWARQSQKTPEENYISKLDQLSDSVSKYIAFTDSRNGNCNLNITIQESAEGTYKCIEAATLKTVTAELIVLEDDPECVVRTDEKVFNITCSVRYLGSWSPTMKWFQVNGTHSVPINAPESIISGQIVTSTALLNRVNVSNGRGHKTLALRCSVNFSEGRRPDKTSATNVPDYEWTSLIFGGGNEEQLDDTSNDCPDNNTRYVAVIATLVLVLLIVLAVGVAILIRKIWRRQLGRETEEYQVAEH